MDWTCCVVDLVDQAICVPNIVMVGRTQVVENVGSLARDEEEET